MKLVKPSVEYKKEYIDFVKQIRRNNEIESSYTFKLSFLKFNFKKFFDYLDYIIEYTDIRQPIDKIAQSKLSETECELLNEFRCLPKEKQNIALGIIMGLKHS